MDVWKAVDSFLAETVVHEDDALIKALANSREHGLPDWEVSPPQGQFLYILARMVKARRILELGSLGGYSAIWLARALPPDGRLVSVEYDPLFAQVARENINNAGLSSLVHIIQGDAAVILDELIKNGEPPFDMIFIDADKPNYSLYLSLVLNLARKGTIIFGDNVVRNGGLADANSKDPKVRGVRRYVNDLGTLTNVVTTCLQTVGSKGYDGFTISVVE